MPERPPQLARLEYLGDAIRFATQIHALIPKCPLLENFSPGEVRLLAHFMEVYRAEPGMEIINEGEGGDFMLMLIEGEVEVPFGIFKFASIKMKTRNVQVADCFLRKLLIGLIAAKYSPEPSESLTEIAAKTRS